jgi:hypothetical protein
MTLFRRHKFNERLFEVLKQELENGRVEGFSRELLYTHFRTNGHLDPTVSYVYIFINFDMYLYF